MSFLLECNVWNVPSKTPALSSYSAARAALEQHTAASTATVPSLLSNRTSKDVHFAVPSPSTRSVIEQLYTLMLENDLRVHRRSCSQSPCAHRCSFLSSCLQLRLQQTCAHRRSSLFMRLFVLASSAGARVRARPPALFIFFGLVPEWPRTSGKICHRCRRQELAMGARDSRHAPAEPLPSRLAVRRLR